MPPSGTGPGSPRVWSLSGLPPAPGQQKPGSVRPGSHSVRSQGSRSSPPGSAVHPPGALPSLTGSLRSPQKPFRIPAHVPRRTLPRTVSFSVSAPLPRRSPPSGSGVPAPQSLPRHCLLQTGSAAVPADGGSRPSARSVPKDPCPVRKQEDTSRAQKAAGIPGCRQLSYNSRTPP